MTTRGAPRRAQICGCSSALRGAESQPDPAESAKPEGPGGSGILEGLAVLRELEKLIAGLGARNASALRRLLSELLTLLEKRAPSTQ